MPIIKSAKKRVRTAKRNYAQNLKYKKAYKKAILDYYKEIRNKSAKGGSASGRKKKLSQAFSRIDKAVKINLIHKNKAARLKSTLSHADLGEQKVKD